MSLSRNLYDITADIITGKENITPIILVKITATVHLRNEFLPSIIEEIGVNFFLSRHISLNLTAIA